MRGFIVALAVLLLGASPAAADTSLKAATFLPSNLALTKDFLTFVDKVNKQVDGVKIDYIGGPEAVPGEKQPQALQRGVLDISYIAPSRFGGLVPEGDALLGMNLAAKDLHESGAIPALSKIFEEKAGVKILAVHHAGLDFNIYLKKEPKFTSEGVLDLTGLPIRTSPTYREFLDALGATPISVPSSEVYSAMERGVAAGLAWPSVDVVSMGLQNTAGYRVEPGFFNAPNITVISLAAWNKLTKGQQDALTKIAREHELWSEANVQEMKAKEAKELQNAGMKLVAVPNSKKYQSLAFDTLWKRLEKRAPESAGKLKALFLKE